MTRPFGEIMEDDGPVTPSRGRPRTNEGPVEGIQALETGIAILEKMIRHGRSMTSVELATVAGLQPNKLHRYLVSFVRTGLMVQSTTTGHYDLGPLARVLGGAAFARFDIMASANQAIETLAAKTGHTSCLFAWNDLGPIMLGRHLGVYPTPATLHVGTVLPLSGTAIGEICIRYLPAEVTAPLLADEAEQVAADGMPPPGPASLEESVEPVSGQTIFWCLSPILPGSVAAAPVLDAQGGLRCIVAAMLPRGRARRDRARVDAALRACALSLRERAF